MATPGCLKIMLCTKFGVLASILFIVRHNAQHAKRDIVLSFLSVCHVAVLYPNEGTYHRTFPPSGRDTILVFEPIALQKKTP